MKVSKFSNFNFQISIIIIACLLLVFSCNRGKEKQGKQSQGQEFQNHLLPPSVSIIYEQALEVPQEYWFFKGFGGKSFVETIIAKSVKDSLKAYYPFSTVEYSPAEVQERVQSIQNEISYMIFDEDWQLDTAQLIMKKYVRSYTLVREYVRKSHALYGTDTVKSIIATFNAPKTTDKPLKDLTLLARNVAYEVSLVNEHNPEWLENMPRKRAVQLIIDKLLAGQQAYSFMFRDTLQPISLDDVKLRLGEEVNYEVVYDELGEETDTVAIQRTIDINEFVGLAFIEDWYYDKATMHLYKDVKGIAPVREYEKILNTGNYEKVRTIPLMMFFSNHKDGK
ncbi:MAG: hypothetical protein LBR55_06590 [Bacteroidales bacterium]|jgi:hypothetical protein|nr:hypothetical protein [Bacteroidales bacterium]